MLEAVAARPARIVLGLISGTSADGIDAAAVRISGQGAAARVKVLATHTHPFPPGLRERLHALTEGGSVRDVCELNVVLGELFAEAAAALAGRVGGVDLIGSHGQTIYHIPPAGGRAGSTLQIGEPAVIAERTGILTVAHFRPRDMAAGGMGAPLVPYADYILFRHPARTRVIQNIGGIANATILPAGGEPADVIAFDTGPGNMVIDALMQRYFGRPYDADGALGAAGRVHEGLLAELLADPFITAPPPKATGRERYGEPYAQEVAARGEALGLAAEDLVATVTAFTADSIVENYRRFVFPAQAVDEVVVAGGGARNRTLLERLRRLLASRPVLTTTDLGIDSDFKEAVAFAIMANDAVMGLATNVPGATGARHPVILGAIIPGGSAP
ncbi:MAG: anhydro-N-acetylmuramic acid kinase [Armatimonadetes bacterium]|nr:anhydro-N-acetylmuramic acid kinase [Armatimonadota bacterium]